MECINNYSNKEMQEVLVISYLSEALYSSAKVIMI